MKAYSKDLREHVRRAVDQGHPRAEIVKMFGVSLASSKRYLKQRRETGDLSPKAIAGRPSKKYAALRAPCKPTVSSGKTRMACGLITRR